MKNLAELRLRNFQCHKDLILRFTDGVNLIIGETGTGKSAVVRALMWLYKNIAPSKNFIYRGETAVSVKATYSDGSYIERFRDSSDNGYDIDGKRYLAIKSELPLDLSYHANRIHGQFDPPFVTVLMGGEGARRLNSRAGLTVADACVTLANQDLKSVRLERDLLEKERQTLTSEICSKARLLELREHLESVMHLRGDIIASKKRILSANESRRALSLVSINSKKQKSLAIALKQVSEQVEFMRTRGDALRELSFFEKSQALGDTNQLLTELCALVNAADKYQEMIKKIQAAKDLIASIKRTSSDFKKISSEASKLKAGIPKKCPLCGRTST